MESKLKICQKRHLWQHCMSKPNVAFAVISGTICLFFGIYTGLGTLLLSFISRVRCCQWQSMFTTTFTSYKIYLWVRRGRIILVLWIEEKRVPSGNFVLYLINAKCKVLVKRLLSNLELTQPNHHAVCFQVVR